MSRLNIKIPDGWTRLTSNESESIFCAFSGECSVTAKVSIIAFNGKCTELIDSFRKRYSAMGVTVVDVFWKNFILNGVKWFLTSFVCVDAEERYQYYYYSFFDEKCIIIQLSSDSIYSALKFDFEVKKFINCLDISNLKEDREFLINQKYYHLKTPSMFRFSPNVSKSQLLFFNDRGYLLVNVKIKGSLREYSEHLIKNANEVSHSLKIRLLVLENNIVQYVILDSDGNIDGSGTYYQNVTDDGTIIISFLYQKRFIPVAKSFLKFGGGKNV